jgi:hypothetical protein
LDGVQVDGRTVFALLGIRVLDDGVLGDVVLGKDFLGFLGNEKAVEEN